MKANIGIIVNSRKEIGQLLNALLADEFVVYIKTWQYHWNVRGQDFFAQHKFLEDLYKQSEKIIDEIAERARALGEPALGSMEDYLHVTRLKEDSRTNVSTKSMLKNLLDDHEKIIKILRDDLEVCGLDFEDEGTANFLTDLMEQHEKIAWMLRASVQK